MRTLKRLFITLALVLLCVGALALSAFAAQSGTLGSNLRWTLDDAGTLTVSGSGSMISCFSPKAPWYSYGPQVKKVVINNGVTSIGEHAFIGCYNMTSITIPSSVTSIGNAAFSGCSKLTSVTLPSGVRYIYDSAFINCSGLQSINIPSGVTYLGVNAFSGCSSLRSVTIPDSVTVIEHGTFIGCTSLYSVTIPNTVTEIGNSAFLDCSNLRSVTIPNSVTAMGTSAFQNCSSLTSLTISTHISVLNSSVFQNCSRLTSVVIPGSVSSIGSGAFKDCTSLSEVTIPNGVTSIGDSAFENCRSLTALSFADYLTVIGHRAFFGCTGLTYIQIPDSVTDLRTYAFSGCTSLRRVSIGNNITSVGSYAFLGCTALDGVDFGSRVASIGQSAFENCTSLYELDIPGTVVRIENRAFAGCTGLPAIAFPSSVTQIGASAFSGCTQLATVHIPNSITRIYGLAFEGCPVTAVRITDLAAWCRINFSDSGSNPLRYAGKLYLNGSLITDLVVPDSVSIIGSYAFVGGALSSVTVGNSTGTIGDYAFSDSTLSSLTLGNGIATVGEYAFSGCDHLTSVYINDLEGWLNICFGSARSNPLHTAGDLYLNGVLVTELDIPTGREAIGAFAFEGCTCLTSVTIPDSVTAIGSSAFSGCTGLAAVTISDNVTAISDNTFSGCTSLTAVTIPDGVTAIGSSAFSGCTGLTAITIPGSVIAIGNSAFSGCAGLTAVIIPDGVTTINDSAFSGCAGLIAVTLPDSVTCIDSNAFRGCTSLAAVAIPERVSTIGSNAFQGCVSLTAVSIPGSVTGIRSGAFADCASLRTVSFEGNAPSLGSDIFAGVTANAYYPTGDATWTNVSQDHGGVIAWSAHRHSWIAASCTTPKTCESCGITKGTVEHSWAPATCTTPKTCTLCGATEGTVLHDWADATCIAPKTCKACGLTEGEALGHAWTPATCTDPKTCGVCGLTEGEALGHQWVDATCAAPRHCTNCGLTEGETLSHHWMDATCTTPKQCTVCYVVEKQTLSVPLADYPESSHPYSNSMDETQVLTVPDAESITLTFSGGTALENQYDHLYVYDGNDSLIASYTGTEAAGVTLTVSGDTVKIRLDTDGSVSAYGYSFANIECFAPGKPLGHAWQEASCTTPKTCTVCGLAEGGALGHAWADATCTAPKICGTCGLTEGHALGHAWASAACLTPKTCQVCGLAEGEALGHAWVGPTCTEAKHCGACGEAFLQPMVPGEYPESDHPYSNAEDRTKILTLPGAQSITLTFSESTEVESAYDFIYVYDGSDDLIATYTGTQAAGVTLTVSGDTVKIRLVTDYSSTGYGYSFDSIEGIGIPQALGHRYETAVIPATPEAMGYTVHTCTRCSDRYTDSPTVCTPAISTMESTASGIRITWKAVAGAAKYRVFVKTSKGWLKLADTAANSYLYTGARTGLTYTFTVRGMNGNGTAFVSAYNAAGWRHKYMPTPAITKLENTASGVKITWGKINGAEKYRVFAKTSKGWLKLGDTTANSFLYTAARSGLTYTFTVRAVNAAGTAFTSAYNTAGWRQTYVAQPAIKSFQNTATGIQISWNKVAGAGAYRIFAKTSKGWVSIGTTRGTSIVWTGGKSGYTYTFTVRAMNAAGTAYISSYNTTGWRYARISQPTVTKLQSTAGGIKLTWGAVSGASKYRVFVKTGKGWSAVGTVTGTGFTWTGAKKGYTYTFTVRCMNAAGTAYISSCNTTGWSVKHT